MSVMMDGVFAPGAGRISAPLLDLSKRSVPEFPQARPVVSNILDLRQPQLVAQAVVATPMQTMAVATPIPYRRPLPPLNWLVTGSAIAILAVGSAVTVPRIVHNVASSKAASARAAVATPAATTAATSKANPAVDAAGAAAALTAEDKALGGIVTQFVANAGAPTYIVIKDLNTGALATSASDIPLTSASLYKLFVAHGIYSKIDDGSLTLGSSVPGTGRNVGDCLKAMITVSDNTCGEALQTMLGVGAYDNALHQYGFTHTSFAQEPNVTSAGDVALLLERLYNGTLLGPTSSEQFLNLLKAQQVNNRLPQGLPAGTTIAHKTGDLYGFAHDAGIVYGPKTNYLVVMMSGSWPNINDAPAKFAELSKTLYGQFNQ